MRTCVLESTGQPSEGHCVLTNSKLMALTPPHQFARMALAYLDSAQSLCQIMENDVDTATYEKGAVVLFLTAHGLELFLKGAILHKSPQETFKHHRIEELHNRYQTLYPQSPYANQITCKALSTGNCFCAKAFASEVNSARFCSADSRVLPSFTNRCPCAAMIVHANPAHSCGVCLP